MPRMPELTAAIAIRGIAIMQPRMWVYTQADCIRIKAIHIELNRNIIIYLRVKASKFEPDYL